MIKKKLLKILGKTLGIQSITEPFHTKFNFPIYHDKRGYVSSERIAEYQFIHRYLDVDNGCTHILDFGCSKSWIPIEFATLGISVYGVDLIKYPLQHPYFTFCQTDIRDLQIGITFDYIYSISVIEHIGLDYYERLIDTNGKQNKKLINPHTKIYHYQELELIEVIEKLHSLLKDNGYLLLTVPIGIPSIDSLLRSFSYQEFINLFKPYFDITIEKHYKRISKNQWIQTSLKEVEKIDNYKTSRLFDGANSVSCFKLQKVNEL